MERCRILRLKNQLNEDYKTVTNLLKMTVKGYGNPKRCQRCFLEVLKQLFPKDFPVWALKMGAVVSLQERWLLGWKSILEELASVGSGAIK